VRVLNTSTGFPGLKYAPRTCIDRRYFASRTHHGRNARSFVVAIFDARRAHCLPRSAFAFRCLLLEWVRHSCLSSEPPLGHCGTAPRDADRDRVVVALCLTCTNRSQRAARPARRFMLRNVRSTARVSTAVCVTLISVACADASASPSAILQTDVGLDQTDAMTDNSAVHDHGATTASLSATTGDSMLVMGPYIDEAALPAGEAGSATTDIETTVEQPSVSDGTGDFRTVCSLSHMNHDDPLVFPDQPGKAHLHAFFGNAMRIRPQTRCAIRATRPVAAVSQTVALTGCRR
jgi:hypothetical protein